MSVDMICVKASDFTDVRLQKVLRVLSDSGSKTRFIGLRRRLGGASEGAGYCVPRRCGYSPLRMGSGKLSKCAAMIAFLGYVFIRALSSRNEVFYCADFEAAFPVALAKRLGRQHRLVYDIYDEVDLRYRLPNLLSALLRKFDTWTVGVADEVVCVSGDRAGLCLARHGRKPLVVENRPLRPTAIRRQRTEHEGDRVFAVTGYLSPTRGVASILRFAREHPAVRLIFAGRFTDSSLLSEVQQNGNCSYLGSLSQERLFDALQGVTGIFSFYDPAVPINRLAASNKLFDAMALGVSVIVNEGLEAASFVREHGIGFVLPYEYDSAQWRTIAECDIGELRARGARGKNLFDNTAGFDEQFSQVLDCVRGSV